MHRLMILCYGLILASSLSAFAAETERSTSLFENPSFTSKQIQVLPVGSEVSVRGPIRTEDGVDWVPVEAPRGSGWVARDHLKLAKDDVGYVHWRGQEHSTWLWFSAGPGMMYSTEFFFTKRLAGGIDYFVNDYRRFFIGGHFSTQFSDEELTSEFNGKVQRYNTYFTLGYILLPDSAYTRLGLGLSVLAGANRNLGYKFGASAAAELGYRVSIGEASKLGLSFSYEYTGKSRQSVNFYQDLVHCVAGGCDPSGLVPAASIFAVNATLFFGL